MKAALLLVGFIMSMALLFIGSAKVIEEYQEDQPAKEFCHRDRTFHLMLPNTDAMPSVELVRGTDGKALPCPEKTVVFRDVPAAPP